MEAKRKKAWKPAEFSNHKPKAKKLGKKEIKRMEKHYSKFW